MSETIKTLLESALFSLAADQLEDCESEIRVALRAIVDFRKDIAWEEDLFHEEDNFSDVEADADVLRSAGMGTDEDYGYFGEEDY
jgi:hypothetical protein